MLFAKALKGQDVGALLANVGTAAGGGGGGAAAAAPTEAAAEEKEEEKKKEDEPEDVDMGGLFGDDDDYWSKRYGFHNSPIRSLSLRKTQFIR